MKGFSFTRAFAFRQVGTVQKLVASWSERSERSKQGFWLLGGLGGGIDKHR